MPKAPEVVEQAGGIAFRFAKRIPTVLVVTARRDPRHWIFPKGHIEHAERASDTALRETQEEAGVDGVIVGPAGRPLEYDWDGTQYRVHYFLIRATSESPSSENRKKAWLPLDEAMARLSFDDLRNLLRDAAPQIRTLA